MSVVIPDNIVYSTRMTEEELLQEIAILLYQKEKLSMGQASERRVRPTHIAFIRCMD